MLSHLHIQNYALIDHLDIDLMPGFSVITGETGAGKSILLGAIGLLLGQRADLKAIKVGENRCIIEAEFDVTGYPAIATFFNDNDLDFDGKECIIRRELSANGKSRAFINDTPASVSQLKELGDQLIDIHSQHQNLLLSRENFQLQVLDTLASDGKLLDEYSSLYKAHKDTKQKLEEAEQNLQKGQDEQEYMQFQFNQLSEAKLQAEEQEQLEEEQSMLEHAEDIKSTLYQTSEMMEAEETGLLTNLRTMQRQISGISRVYAKAEEMADRLDTCLVELKEIARDIEDQAESVDYDPERLQEVTERLNLIYDLEQKHHVDSIEELLTIQSKLEQQLSAIENSDEEIAQLKVLITKQEEQLTALAQRLTTERTKAGEQMQKEMCSRLAPLGMPNVRFEVCITPTQTFEAQGMDKVQFMFCANKNGNLQPISQVASGGEIARVMLSLKALINTAVQLPTIIFDEIDTGVSGHIAESMANIMHEMGSQEHRQVISITHLPQIAALGDHHYRVYKEDDEQGTTSHIIPLTEEQRVEELAHMLSGSTLSQAAIDNARALLAK